MDNERKYRLTDPAASNANSHVCDHSGSLSSATIVDRLNKLEDALPKCWRLVDLYELGGSERVTPTMAKRKSRVCPTTVGLAGTFKRERESCGLSQREAATRLRITAVHLCNIECGHSEPSLSLLKRACRLYWVDLWAEAKGT